MLVKQKQVEKWDVFEIELHAEGWFDNPFKDVHLEAVFETGDGMKNISGFYDGGSTWIIRFMPEETGTYSFRTVSNVAGLDGLKGTFDCIPPSPGKHGPVRTEKTYHFSYADGTPFFAMGTTAYAWFYRPEEVRRQTLEAINQFGFNKVRMLVFPKHIRGGNAIEIAYDPLIYPYEGEKNHFDFDRFNPEYFRRYEARIRELMELDIQADVILFHEYDFGMWDLDKMGDEQALFYVKYMIARLGAFRNVWWSLANEYNILQNAGWRNWDAIGDYLMEKDPYQHPRSIHNWSYGPIYPDREWMTHVCCQNPNTYSLMLDLKRSYHKPVINDEYEYEGNLPFSWGNSTAKTTLLRHWLTAMAGGYGTHGECYQSGGNKRDIFWTYGGRMIGESAPRLKFMKEVMEQLPYQEMEPDLTLGFDPDVCCLRKGMDLYLFLFRESLPGKNISFGPQDGTAIRYEATIYDIWNCSIREVRWVQKPREIEITGWTAVKLVRS